MRPEATQAQAETPAETSRRLLVSLATLVNAYMRAGRMYGFHFAETVLLGYLPASKAMNGRCVDVPAGQRQFMIDKLLEGSTEKAPAPAPEAGKVHFAKEGAAGALCREPRHHMHMTSNAEAVTCGVCLNSLNRLKNNSPRRR